MNWRGAGKIVEWAHRGDASLGPNDKRTVVLIAVQGGVARAGYRTALALAELQTAVAKRTRKERQAGRFRRP
jgi:hypothetical protein